MPFKKIREDVANESIYLACTKALTVSTTNGEEMTRFFRE